MKKILFSALILITGLASAQKTKFSATVGFVSVSTDYKLSRDYLGNPLISSISKSLAGISLGINAEIYLSKKLDIRTGLLFVKAGELFYIQSPILFKYEIVNRLGILVGPQINIGIQESTYFTNNPEGKIGLSFDSGLNYDISDKFYIEARYTLQLLKIIDDDFSRIFTGETTHSFLNFGVGYRF